MTTLFSQLICTHGIELFSQYKSNSQLQDNVMQYTGGRNLVLAEKKRNCADALCKTLQTYSKTNKNDLEFKQRAGREIQKTLHLLNTICTDFQTKSGKLEPLIDHYNQLTQHAYDTFEQNNLLNLKANLGEEDAAIILKKHLASYLIKNKSLHDLKSHKAEYGYLKGLIRYSGRNITVANKKEQLIEHVLTTIDERTHSLAQQSGHYNATILNIIEEIRKNNNIIREESSYKGHLPVSLGSFIFTVHVPTEFKQGQGSLEDYLTAAENKIATLTLRNPAHLPQHSASKHININAFKPADVTHTLPAAIQFPTSPTLISKPMPATQAAPPPSLIPAQLTTTHTTAPPPRPASPTMKSNPFFDPLQAPAQDEDFARLSAMFGLTSPT